MTTKHFYIFLLRDREQVLKMGKDSILIVYAEERMISMHLIVRNTK